MCRQNTFSVSTGHSKLWIICGLKRLYHHDDKTFSIHKLWLLSGGRGVSGRHRQGVLTAHNWCSVEYETAASGTTQQYKKKCKCIGSRGVVIGQWLEYRWLKVVALGLIPSSNQDFSFFFFVFFSDP